MNISNPLLRAHLKKGRVAPTYLFTGPAPERSVELALRFCQALNCEQGRVFEACNCGSCGKVERGLHPDVKRLGEEEKNRSIKIEEIRTLIYEASLRPFEGKWKVFILEGAQRLTVDASNALLKTLEEPPEHSVFILLVKNKSHLLETIQSRAVEIRVPPAAEKDPVEDPLIRLLKEGKRQIFWDRLRDLGRNELAQALEILMSYLRDRSVAALKKDEKSSRDCLEAGERVYETKEALSANVNQKLALTHLEIHLEKLLR